MKYQWTVDNGQWTIVYSLSGEMVRNFTLEYWMDDGWFVGRLKEVLGVFSQGETLEDLEKNVRDAYRLMMEDDETPAIAGIHSKEMRLEV